MQGLITRMLWLRCCSLSFYFSIGFARLHLFIHSFATPIWLIHQPPVNVNTLKWFSFQRRSIRGKRREEKWTTTKIVRQNNLTLAPNVISKPFLQLYKRYVGTLYILKMPGKRKNENKIKSTNNRLREKQWRMFKVAEAECEAAIKDNERKKIHLATKIRVT